MKKTIKKTTRRELIAIFFYKGKTICTLSEIKRGVRFYELR